MDRLYSSVMVERRKFNQFCFGFRMQYFHLGFVSFRLF